MPKQIVPACHHWLISFLFFFIASMREFLVSNIMHTFIYYFPCGNQFLSWAFWKGLQRYRHTHFRIPYLLYQILTMLNQSVTRLQLPIQSAQNTSQHQSLITFSLSSPPLSPQWCARRPQIKEHVRSGCIWWIDIPYCEVNSWVIVGWLKPPRTHARPRKFDYLYLR